MTIDFPEPSRYNSINVCAQLFARNISRHLFVGDSWLPTIYTPRQYHIEAHLARITSSNLIDYRNTQCLVSCK